MITRTDIEKLIYTLNLSPFQARQIYMHRQEYDIGRLQMRGDVLFAPRREGFISRIMHGASGDIIGRNRMFLRGAQRVQMRAGGYHTGCVGRSTYYGDPMGRAIMRDAFNAAGTKNK